MNGAKAALDAALAADEHARNNLNDTKMYAPDSGIIMTRIQEPGAVVGTAQPVYTMSKKTPLWIRAYIPETQLANVKYGTAAQIITDSVNPDNGQARAYNGYVGYISPVAEFTPKPWKQPTCEQTWYTASASMSATLTNISSRACPSP